MDSLTADKLVQKDCIFCQATNQSFGYNNSCEQVDSFMEILKKIISANR